MIGISHVLWEFNGHVNRQPLKTKPSLQAGIIKPAGVKAE